MEESLSNISMKILATAEAFKIKTKWRRKRAAKCAANSYLHHAHGTLLALCFLATWGTVSALDLDSCNSPLGMESGAIADSQISASSSYDITITGPLSGRLNIQRHGGAWCPKYPIGSKDSQKQFLEIDLLTVHALSGVITQGRYGNGVGVEFVENFILEYWRPGFGDWKTYRLFSGEEVLPGNMNTYSPEERQLLPSILASKIRFVPYSNHQRTVCMRVELLGCPYTDGVASYSGIQGQDKDTELLLQDSSFDGASSDGRLHEGLGQLSDGVIGAHNINADLGHGKGYEWVGWRNISGRPVEFVFEFDRVRNFSHIFIYTNNMFTNGVKVFSDIHVWLSIGGEYFTQGPLEYHYLADSNSEFARNVTVQLSGRVAKFVKLQMFFADNWIMVSEIYFLSNVVPGNFTAETEVDALKIQAGRKKWYKEHSRRYMHDGTLVGGAAHKNLVITDMTGQTSSEEHVVLVIGILVAVICLLVSAILLICWRARRQKAGLITHDVYTGPYGEKRDVVNLKDVQKYLKPPVGLQPIFYSPTSCTSSGSNSTLHRPKRKLPRPHSTLPRFSTYSKAPKQSSITNNNNINYQRASSHIEGRKNKNYQLHDNGFGLGLGGHGKSGLYSEPYHLDFNTLVGYPQQHKDSSHNRLSSPDYTVPHIPATSTEDDLYAPPLPQYKPPFQTPFASFMSKQSLLGQQSTSSTLLRQSNLTGGTLNSNAGGTLRHGSNLSSNHGGSTMGSTLGGTLGSTPACSSGATASSTSGGSTTGGSGILQQEENFYATTEIINNNGVSESSDLVDEDQPVVTEDKPPREITPDKITLLQKLGEGQFGEVHLGEVETEGGSKQVVAVKTLRLEASNTVRCGFEREVQILAKLRDPHIVGVVGVCTQQEPLCLVVEYLEHGDLNQYLQARVVETTSSRVTQAETISYGCLIYMATQIAAGMKYLEALNFVHRDLATRNCLVGGNNKIKISDFGMSRAMYSGDYYHSEGAGILPIRWMAWESAMLGKYTTKSDVWAYAVTLWEVLSMAREQPFEDLTDSIVLQNLASHYHNDARKVVYLSAPAGCPKEIYELMKECWRRNDVDRPTFREIHMFLLRKNLGFSPLI